MIGQTPPDYRAEIQPLKEKFVHIEAVKDLLESAIAWGIIEAMESTPSKTRIKQVVREMVKHV